MSKEMCAPSFIYLKRITIDKVPEIESLDQLNEMVTKEFRIPLNSLKISKRSFELVMARKVFCLLARKHTKHSLSFIADYLNRNHSTVIYSIESGNDLLEFDKYFKAKYHSCLDLTKNVIINYE